MAVPSRLFLRGSAVLHALLILHSSLQQLVIATSLSFTQTRLTISEGESMPWSIEGIAAVEIGNADVHGYWIECTSSTTSIDSLRWIREVGNYPFGEIDRIEPRTIRMNIVSSELLYQNLGIYICEDTASRVTANLSITADNPAVSPRQANVEGTVGGQVELAVYASTITGQPPEEDIIWKDPDNTTLEDDQSGVQFQTSKRRLILSDLTTSHSGVYRCIVIYSLAGTGSYGEAHIELKVFAPSKIIFPPSDVNTTDNCEDVNRNVSLVCMATGSAPVTISWKRVGFLELPTEAVEDVMESQGVVTSTLTLRSLYLERQGTYRCEATNGDGFSSYSHTDTADATVTVNSQLTIKHENLQNGYLLTSEGAPLFIECFGCNHNITWYTDTGYDITFNNNDNIYKEYNVSQRELTLKIKSFSADMIGTYTCGSDLVPSLQKSVYVTNIDPLVLIANNLIYMKNGRNIDVSVSVIVLSNSEITVEWYWNEILLDLESDSRYSTTSEGSLLTLTIRDFTNEESGRLRIFVTNSMGGSVNDTIDLAFPDPPIVIVSPSREDVYVGETVAVVCTAGGTEPLDYTWTLGDGDSLPEGVVVANGNNLIINSVSLRHHQTYVCTVSNIIGQAHATFNLGVFDPPLAKIMYKNSTNASYNVSFVHGDGNPPSFTCIVRGYPVPTVQWQLYGGGSLPSSVTTGGGGNTLTWKHRLQYSDSGLYQCIATNSKGEQSTAYVNMTVIHKPTLDTIFSVPGVSGGSRDVDYVVPVHFSGSVLKCIGFASPPPTVKWTKDSGALPSEVEWVAKEDGGIVTAELVFSKQFGTANIGEYQCEVHGSDGDREIVKKAVHLSQGSSSSAIDSHECRKINSNSFLFQLRILTENCGQWNTTRISQIAGEFENILKRIATAECEDCNISSVALTVNLDCSSIIDGGIRVRGSVESSSATTTGNVFCALSEWQSSRALVTIDDNLYIVDSGCSLFLDKYDSEECVEPPPSDDTTDKNDTILIAGIASVGGAIILILILVGFFSLCFCCCRQYQRWKPEVSDEMGGAAQTHSFTRTESNSQFQNPHTTFSPDSRLQMDGMQHNPVYGGSTSSYSENVYLPDPGPVYDEARTPDHHPSVGRSRMPPYSPPKEVETTFTDRGGSFTTDAAPLVSNSPPTRTNIVQPYQKPVSSTGNLTRIGASNPMWGLKEEHSAPQNNRRFSEGTPTNNPSRATPVPSSNRRSQETPAGHPDQTQGLAAQRDGEKVPLRSTTSGDNPPMYSRLNHNGGPTGYIRSSDPPPNPNWYRTSSIVSEESFYRISGTIRPYETVRNSQIPLSPDDTQTSSNTTRGFVPPKGVNGTTPNSSQGHLNVPCGSDNASIPSLPRMRENPHFERILV